MTDKRSNDMSDGGNDQTDDIFRQAIAQRVQQASEPRPYWELPGLVHQQEPRKRWFEMKFNDGYRSNQIGFVLAGAACVLLVGLGVWSLTGTSESGDVQVATDPTVPEVDDSTVSQPAESTEDGDGEPANDTADTGTAEESGDAAESDPVKETEEADEPGEEPTPEIVVLGPDGSGVGELVYLPFPDDDPDAECRFGQLGHRNAAGELHIYEGVESLGNVRHFEGGDGQVALVSNCEELVDTVIIASSSPGDPGPPELSVFPIPGDWLMLFSVDAQIRYVDTVWLADVDRGNGLEEVRFELDTMQIVPASEPTTGTAPEQDASADIEVAYVCADGSTGSTATDTEDVDQIDDYINGIDLCEGVGGVQSISFPASCGDLERTVTVGAEGGVPDIATIDYCE